MSNYSDNDFYLDTPPPVLKDYYEDALHILSRELSQDNVHLLDAGCATGDFLELIRGTHKSIKLFGTDINPDYLSSARNRIRDASFLENNLLDFNPDFSSKFDVITLFGVIQQFDELGELLTILSKYLKVQGTILIFSHFNPHGIDVLINYRHVDSSHLHPLQRGWNIHSVLSVESESKKLGFGSEFQEFRIRTEIPMKENRVRSWTYQNEKGELLITNGLCLNLFQGFMKLSRDGQ